MEPKPTIIETCTESGAAVEFEVPGVIGQRQIGKNSAVWMPCLIDGLSARITAPSRPKLRDKLVEIYLLTEAQALKVCPL